MGNRALVVPPLGFARLTKWATVVMFRCAKPQMNWTLKSFRMFKSPVNEDKRTMFGGGTGNSGTGPDGTIEALYGTATTLLVSERGVAPVPPLPASATSRSDNESSPLVVDGGTKTLDCAEPCAVVNRSGCALGGTRPFAFVKAPAAAVDRSGCAIGTRPFAFVMSPSAAAPVGGGTNGGVTGAGTIGVTGARTDNGAAAAVCWSLTKPNKRCLISRPCLPPLLRDHSLPFSVSIFVFGETMVTTGRFATHVLKVATGAAVLGMGGSTSSPYCNDRRKGTVPYTEITTMTFVFRIVTVSFGAAVAGIDGALMLGVPDQTHTEPEEGVL